MTECHFSIHRCQIMHVARIVSNHKMNSMNNIDQLAGMYVCASLKVNIVWWIADDLVLTETFLLKSQTIHFFIQLADIWRYYEFKLVPDLDHSFDFVQLVLFSAERGLIPVCVVGRDGSNPAAIFRETSQASSSAMVICLASIRELLKLTCYFTTRAFAITAFGNLLIALGWICEFKRRIWNITNFRSYVR